MVDIQSIADGYTLSSPGSQGCLLNGRKGCAVDEDQRAYLQILQNVIGRQAGNCLQVKEWTVVIVAALFALGAKDANPCFIVVAVLPTLIFWGLDAYYLRQERLFRGLYDRARRPGADSEIFSMDTLVVRGDVKGWRATLFAKTVWPVYVPILLALAGVLLMAGS